MKKLLSTRYTTTTFNLATLLLRTAFGFLMCLGHGIPKLSNFNELQLTFFDAFHIGHRWSLILAIFAEVFASMLLVLGLFSRIAAFILLIDMAVVIFLVHKGQPVRNFEDAVMYSVAYLCILLIGPGKISVDGITGK